MKQAAPLSEFTPSPRLWLHQVDESFDPETDAVIGPWCFQGVEDKHPEWTRLPFGSRFEDGAEIYQAANDIRVFANALVPPFAERLNRQHGVSHGLEYWRTILLPWLIFVLPAIYRRYVEIADFVSKNHQVPYSVAIDDTAFDWRAASLRDLWHDVFGDHGFHFWLSSRILERIHPPDWTLERAAARHPGPDRPAAGATQRNLATAWKAKSRCRAVPGVRQWQVPLSLLLSALPRKQKRPYAPAPELAASQAALPVPFTKLLDDILWPLLPETLTTGFSDIDRQAQKHTFRPGKVNLVGPVLMLDEGEKFRLAHAREQGELVVCSQHGGQGYQLLPLPLAETEYKQDAYLTWGWTNQNNLDGNFIPVPSPLFSRWADKHKEKEDRLLLVSTDLQMYSQRLQTTELQGAFCIENRDQKKTFLAALPPAILSRTTYRPYPKSRGALEDETYLQRFAPEISVAGPEVSPRALRRLMLRCRLLVVDHPVTTFSFAMAANVPCIGFWNPRAWPMTPQSSGIFAALTDAGVIHHSADAASRHAGQIWHDVDAWWKSPQVQAARIAFCRQYARTDRFWWWHWAKALWNL